MDRAGVCLRSERQFKQLSSDFTPESDRQRIQHIAFQRPELLRCPHTKEKLYNRHILSRKVGGKNLMNLSCGESNTALIIKSVSLISKGSLANAVHRYQTANLASNVS